MEYGLWDAPSGVTGFPPAVDVPFHVIHELGRTIPLSSSSRITGLSHLNRDVEGFFYFHMSVVMSSSCKMIPTPPFNDT